MRKSIYSFKKIPHLVSELGVYHSADLGLISITQDGQNWITIADKNVGASVVYNAGDTLSESNCGKFFQWGNNYGFPFTGTNNVSYSDVDTTGYGPGNYYSSDVFIQQSPRDNPANNNLWGEVTNTLAARQGPCANGFHIPNKEEFDRLFGMLTGLDISEILKMPLAGWLWGGEHELPGIGRYFTTGYYNQNPYSYAVMAYIEHGYTQYYYKMCGCNIRPFKDTPVIPDATWEVLYGGGNN